MIFDIIALWTGKVILLSTAWFILFWIWYGTIHALWGAHKNFMITRKFALYDQPQLFQEFITKELKKKKVKNE
jgi:hypothetical protein